LNVRQLAPKGKAIHNLNMEPKHVNIPFAISGTYLALISFLT